MTQNQQCINMHTVIILLHVSSGPCHFSFGL